MQVFPPSVLPLLNFPLHSNSYSVCECAHISIRPLEMPLQFPGRLYWWIYTVSIRANAELEITLHYWWEMFLNNGQSAHQKQRWWGRSSILHLCVFCTFLWDHLFLQVKNIMLQITYFQLYETCNSSIGHPTTVTSAEDEPFPGDSSSNKTISLALFNKPLRMRSHSSDLGALLPCNHVLLYMATFVISRWQPNVRRKQFYLMDDHKRGRGYISFMPRQWITHNKIP